MRRQFIMLEAHRETPLSLPFLGPFQRAPPTELKQPSQAERYQQKMPIEAMDHFIFESA